METMMTDPAPVFSEADAQALSELLQRQAAAALAARRASLEAVIAAAPSADDTRTLIAAMRSTRSTVDLDTAGRLDRLALILENDLLPLLVSVEESASAA